MMSAQTKQARLHSGAASDQGARAPTSQQHNPHKIGVQASCIKLDHPLVAPSPGFRAEQGPLPKEVSFEQVVDLPLPLGRVHVHDGFAVFDDVK